MKSLMVPSAEQTELKAIENVQENSRMKSQSNSSPKTEKEHCEIVTSTILRNGLQVAEEPARKQMEWKVFIPYYNKNDNKSSVCTTLQLTSLVGNLIHEVSNDVNYSGTVADRGLLLYLEVTIRKEDEWIVPAQMIILPNCVITDTAKVCLFVPNCDLDYWRSAIAGSEVTNKIEVFGVNSLKDKADDDLRKLCEDFDVYLAEECVYQQVIQYLSRHILLQKFPILVNFLHEDHDDINEFIQNAFSRMPVVFEGDGYRFDIVVGNTCRNNAKQITHNILAIVNWLDQTFSGNVDMIESLHVKTENSQANIICLCNRTYRNWREKVRTKKMNTHSSVVKKINKEIKKMKGKKEKMKSQNVKHDNKEVLKENLTSIIKNRNVSSKQRQRKQFLRKQLIERVRTSIL